MGAGALRALIDAGALRALTLLAVGLMAAGATLCIYALFQGSEEAR